MFLQRQWQKNKKQRCPLNVDPLLRSNRQRLRLFGSLFLKDERSEPIPANEKVCMSYDSNSDCHKVQAVSVKCTHKEDTESKESQVKPNPKKNTKNFMIKNCQYNWTHLNPIKNKYISFYTLYKYSNIELNKSLTYNNLISVYNQS